MSATGWQQPAQRRAAMKPKCPHLGLLFAAFTINQHPEGHQWVCACGASFRVVSNGGRDKRLVPDWRPALAALAAPAPDPTGEEEGK